MVKKLPNYLQRLRNSKPGDGILTYNQALTDINDYVGSGLIHDNLEDDIRDCCAIFKYMMLEQELFDRQSYIVNEQIDGALLLKDTQGAVLDLDIDISLPDGFIYELQHAHSSHDDPAARTLSMQYTFDGTNFVHLREPVNTAGGTEMWLGGTQTPILALVGGDSAKFRFAVDALAAGKRQTYSYYMVKKKAF